MQTTRTFQFVSDDDDTRVKCLKVVIPEIVDPQYGLFTWPCAPVLAQFIFFHQNWIQNKNVLEIGCGTALPGVVAAKVGANVILSDSLKYENCLANCQKSCELNKLENVSIVPITWGKATKEIFNMAKIDVILGSDCFYDKKDFEDILFTVRCILDQHKEAVFWTTYQVRSSDYSIEFLLHKWNLQCRLIPLHCFGAAGELVGNSDMHSKHTIQMMEISLLNRS